MSLVGQSTGTGIALSAAASGAMLYQMRSWSIDYWGGLLPPLRILGTYGLFFLFGWLLFKRREVLDRFKRPAWGYFMAGLVCFFIHRYFVDTGCGTGRFCDPTAVGEHVGAILFLAPTIWFLVYGFLGLFLRYMERPSVPWRYMADASYWMYIVHPPLVMVLPTFLASVALPAMVKFLLVLSAATAVIFGHLPLRGASDLYWRATQWAALSAQVRWVARRGLFTGERLQPCAPKGAPNAKVCRRTPLGFSDSFFVG